ncbi:ABC transporter [Ahniella affigens]|uniref:ABC transporter n=1 Tax=Ahniella affigens TaxID=2021234 RepID=A0A2P1PQ40_9GAMM|nr:ABC transporter transmembrane domain-containing protein [Ahniella affigens]AVP96938.1 ABC transporter [Ahniella affigens]
MSSGTEAGTRSGFRWSAVRQVWPYLQPYRGLILGWLAFLGLSSAATLTLPFAARLMIEQGFTSGNRDAVNQAFLLLGLVALVLAIATALRFFFISILGERVSADLRKRLYRHLLSLDATFFEKNRSGELLSRITADAELVQTVVGSSMSVALRSVIMLVGASALLVWTNPKLAAYAALAIPLAMLPILVFGRRVRKLSRQSQDRFAETSAQAAESLGAMHILKAFTRESVEADRFDGSIGKVLATANQRIGTRALLTFLIIALVFGSITLVLWVGAGQVLDGHVSAGVLTQFVLYAVTAAGSVGALTEVWGEVQRAGGAMDRITEVLDTKPDIRDAADARRLPDGATGSVVFREVTFAYPSRREKPALNAVSFSVAPGETIALVGPSGAGKSTIFQLMLRFYDVDAGSIEIGGQPIKALTLESLRSAFALVPQDSVLFAMSAAENIRVGRAKADESDVRHAAAQAEAAAFIEALPQGYDTDLGERGVKLSGGQQQRIAIARALLRKAPILLLDEATSSLDAQSEAAIQNALEGVRHQVTTIVIAHRLATVQKADRILVIDQGEVVAEGSHDALIAQGGLYAELARLQFDLGSKQS